MALRQASGSVRPALSFRGARAFGAPDAARSLGKAWCQILAAKAPQTYVART